MNSAKGFIRLSIAFCLLQLGTVQSYAQNQHIADSLKIIYKANVLQGEEKLELLRNLAFNEMNDIELAIGYSEELIELSTLQDNDIYLYRGYLQKGNKMEALGNLTEALEAFQNCERVAIKTGYKGGEGMVYMSIANTYSNIDDSKNAEFYYKKSIQIFRDPEILKGKTDSISLGTALANAGDEFLKNNKDVIALNYFEEAGSIFKKTNFKAGITYILGNMGMFYAERGQYDLAKNNLVEAIQLLEEVEDYIPISAYQATLATIYSKQNDLQRAIDYAESSLEHANRLGLKNQISETSLILSRLYEQIGNFEESKKHFITYIDRRETISEIEKVREKAKMDQLENQIEIQDVKTESQQRLIIATVITLFFIIVLAVVLYRRYGYVKRINKIIAKEKDRSDELLLNILPKDTANELRNKGKVAAKKFNSVTVLFTDFQGFTHFAENLPPEDLVRAVDYYFSQFDKIMEKYGLEKIKTVGDSYMCAGGLPFPSEDHPVRMIRAAFEIIDFVKESYKHHELNEIRFEIRIGINTGPVVAGVVGTKKFSYDIWGDAVNIASRMETNSEPGRINISEYTYQLIKDEFDCEPRGPIDVKNHGKMNMYFVNGLI